MELGETHAVGIEDGHDGRVGYIDTDFNDGGSNKDLNLAAREGVERSLLFFAIHASVEQPESIRLQNALLELDENLFGAVGIVVTFLIDARRDDIGLATGGHLLGNEFPPFIMVIGFAEVGVDFGSTFGFVFEDGKIEISHRGHGEGPWDGGRGEDEIVGLGGPFAKGGSLFDAEFVLFIDHDKSEFGELDMFAEECLGADDDVDRSEGDAFLHFGAIAGGEGANEEPNFDLAPLEALDEA